jgi:hypothetical protein
MPGLGLESRSDIDGVVEDVQALDSTVRGQGGDVNDIERSGGAGWQSPVKVEPEADRCRVLCVSACHDGLEPEVGLARVGEKSGVKVARRLGAVERRVDDRVLSEQADGE